MDPGFGSYTIIMAQFEIAERITGRNEGGYANHPDDRGGETYAGIARKFWPKWDGWKRIDQIKKTHGASAAVINKHAKADQELVMNIVAFYKANFWDANKLSQFEDQQIANSVYDFGVNSGVMKAAVTLQKVLGVDQDGKIGRNTLGAVNSGDAHAIHAKYNELRESFYRNLAKSPSQAKFLKSWLSRLRPYQNG